MPGENDGVFLGFDNPQDAFRVMRELREWEALKEAKDRDEAIAFLVRAHTKTKYAIVATAHNEWVEAEQSILAVVNLLTMFGLEESAYRPFLEGLHAMHVFLHEVPEHFSEMPKEEKKPTLSPEEDQTAFDIFSKVFGGTSDNSEWL